MKTFLWAAMLAGVCSAAIPQFTEWESVYAGGSLIAVSYGSPCITDWDNDGLQDLLLGRMYLGGRIDFYKNIGTNASPQLASRIKLKTDDNTYFLPTC